jgi:hypothetical protein
MHLEGQIVGVVGADVLYIEAQSFSGFVWVRKKLSDPSVLQGLLPLTYTPVPKHTTWVLMTRCN